MESTNAAQETLPKKLQRRASFSPIKAIRSLSIGSQVSHQPIGSSSDAPNNCPQRRPWRKSMPPGALRVENLIRKDSKSSNECSTRRDSTSTRRTTPSMTSRRTSFYEDGDLVVIKSGPLLPEPSILRPRREYLVLTPCALFKFKSYSAAKEQFPIIQASEHGAGPESHPESHASLRSLSSSAEINVPLGKVVSAFKADATGTPFGLEIWWKISDATHAFTSLGLEFGLSDERDDWLQKILKTARARGEETGEERVPPEIEFNFTMILHTRHKDMRPTPIEIYPVVPREPYTGLATEVKKNWRESSSFYLAFTKYSLFLAQFSWSPNGQKLNPSLMHFGLVNFSRVHAHVNDERFSLVFRLPLEQPKKLQLSSRYYRAILSRLFKEDMYLKPAWPPWTREAFHMDDESRKMPLPNGEDYGGFKTTLEAFLEGYRCPPVEWIVKWKGVRSHQLLAVFRALRFNEFFHGISFRDIDFSNLVNKFDNAQRLESTIWLSRTGNCRLTRSEVNILESASVLFQELVSILLGSESIKYIDMTNILRKASALSSPHNDNSSSTPTRCNSITLNGNAIGETDAVELYRVLQNRPNFLRVLEISRCSLDEASLVYLFEGLREQRFSLEELDTSYNSGRVEASKVAYTLSEASTLKRLNLAYTIRGDLEGPLFRPWGSTSSQAWRLEELDLSGWKLNFDTSRMIMEYLTIDESKGLRRLSLNNCGLTGELATGIFCQIGAGRNLHLSLNGNPLEAESTDWIDLIHANEAPTKLHLDMIQFQHETNFNKLLTALSHNKTIEFLSMAGTGPPGRVTSKTSNLLSKFFRTNDTLKFLDLSGYSGKLEDGELGWGLSDALGGLSDNVSLRQLRLRNHDMGAAEDLTELCRVLSGNKGLAMVDIRNNNFDHRQFGKLVHSLSYNHQLISFPISEADREYAVNKERRRILESEKRPTVRRHDKLIKSTERHVDGLLTWLHQYWDSEATEVRDTLTRNRENAANQLLEFESEYLEAWDDADLSRWLVSKPTVPQRDKGKRRASEPIIMTSMGDASLQVPSGPVSPMWPSGRYARRASYPPPETYVIEEEA